MLRVIFSYLAGKTAICLLRLFGRNATTLPGRIALALSKNIPAVLARNARLVLITGTNGKTTATRILSSVYRENGIEVITNRSGANLLSGLTAALIEGTRFSRVCQLSRKSGNSHKDASVRIVLEMDEGAFGRFADILRPDIAVVTNLFRDQLDRYGELAKTREMIRRGIADVPECTVVLCADDSMVASLAQGLPNRILFNGIDSAQLEKGIDKQTLSTEAGYCMFCSNPYTYQGRSFGHLGDYICPSCGFARPKPDITCSYEHTGNNYYRMRVRREGCHGETALDVPIPGEHNVYNALTAISAAAADGLTPDDCTQGVESAQAGFGRMEKIQLGDKQICIVLVKNPVGMDRALSFLEKASDAGPVMFLLNDRIADGTDVSWIWDVDFETRSIGTGIYVSGDRCFDLALRLQYSGIHKENIPEVSDEFEKVFEKAIEATGPGECFYLLPNYTSMLDLRSYLEKKHHLKGIWE